MRIKQSDLISYSDLNLCIFISHIINTFFIFIYFQTKFYISYFTFMFFCKK